MVGSKVTFQAGDKVVCIVDDWPYKVGERCIVDFMDPAGDMWFVKDHSYYAYPAYWALVPPLEAPPELLLNPYTAHDLQQSLSYLKELGRWEERVKLLERRAKFAASILAGYLDHSLEALLELGRP